MVRAILGIAGLLIVVGGELAATSAQTVQPCPDPATCAHIAISGGSGKPGDILPVTLSFTPGPSDGTPGGLDEIATLALTLSIAGNDADAPLVLADCAVNASGLPNAVTPGASLSGFNVVVQNATCSAKQTHCLCPDPGSGLPPDQFINLAIFAPAAMTGSDTVQVPVLPTGDLLTIALQIQPGATGTIPLHVFAPWADSQHPSSTAFVSVGDTLAVDQTCVPVAGTPPCAGPGAVSQISIADGAISVLTPTATAAPSATFTNSPVPDTATPSPVDTATPTAPAPTNSVTPELTATVAQTATPSPVPATSTPTVATCVGDCNGDGIVTVDELLTMVNIALGNAQLQSCVAGDGNNDGQISVDEILTAVNNGLNGCPSAALH